MDELVLYVTRGDPDDKHAKESLGAVSSIQKSHLYTTFRSAQCPPNGAALSGFGSGERLFVAAPDRALINCYCWGKEGVDQQFAVPEQLTCLAVAPFPATADADRKPAYRTPWLLAGGSKTGRLYVWELASGDLVCVKDAHYQGVTAMGFSQCGTFLATGGADTRVNVWRTAELVGRGAEARPESVADHSLAVTCVQLTGAGRGVRLTSGSRDGTLRVYDVHARRLITTVVVGAPVECVAQDPAGRALYAGLADGRVRQVPLYAVNPYTRVLEAVGGGGKIVTLAEDVDMRETFAHHVTEGHVTAVSAVAVSMDGMYLVSGDSAGRTFVADVVTRQVVKSFTACKSGIAYVQVGVADAASLASDVGGRKHRMLPSLKRVLQSPNAQDHAVVVQLSAPASQPEPFADWLQRKAAQELRMHAVQAGSTREAQLQAQVDKLSDAYSTLREDYDELLQRT